MGAIKINVQGSFRPNASATFSAMEHGHADAVAQAVEWLSAVILPQAIRRDHDLHERGDKPRSTFGHEPVEPARPQTEG